MQSVCKYLPIKTVDLAKLLASMAARMERKSGDWTVRGRAGRGWGHGWGSKGRDSIDEVFTAEDSGSMESYKLL